MHADLDRLKHCRSEIKFETDLSAGVWGRS